MDISPTTLTPAQPGTPAQNDADKISSDFETFLNMLTVQLKNQDPLDPMKSADFSMQLATFSGVEQQVKTNDLLTALTQQSEALGLAKISDWIGMEVLAATTADFDGTPIEVHIDTESRADSAFLIVKNDLGQEVERQKIDAKDGPIQWTGIGADGQTMLSGTYSFHVESFEGKELLSSQQATVYAQVSEVASNAGVLSVVLATGDTVDASLITSLRTVPAVPGS